GKPRGLYRARGVDTFPSFNPEPTATEDIAPLDGPPPCRVSVAAGSGLNDHSSALIYRTHRLSHTGCPLLTLAMSPTDEREESRTWPGCRSVRSLPCGGPWKRTS